MPRDGSQVTVDVGRDVCGDLAAGEAREWLVTNGIGGFASGTMAGSLTRRYHGLLVAAQRPPVGRMLLVTKIDDAVQYGATTVPLATNRWASGSIDPLGYTAIERFRLEGTTPVWSFAVDDALVEKRIWMEPGRNLTYVRYTVLRAALPVGLSLRVLVNYRDFHATTRAGDWRMQVDADGPRVRIVPYAGATPIWIVTDRGLPHAEHTWYRGFALTREADRGLDSLEDHLLAASLDVQLGVPGDWVTLALAGGSDAPAIDASAYERRRAHEQARLAEARALLTAGDDAPPDWIEQLVLAADQFVVARPLAGDPQAASIIAGYHWFGDWGRDTMIALPGIALATGRAAVAEKILRTFARFIDGGMLPNYFPDAGAAPEYNTVDAALWYVEAVRAFDAATGDPRLARDLFAVLVSIVDAYERGTRYHIGLDPADGLIFAGEPGVQLTWMDAKVGDWVVTPRIGKPVEVNALWYNALCALEVFARREGNSMVAERCARLAKRSRRGFARYWNAELGCCFDVLDGPSGNDPALRPNQLLAAALPYSPLTLDQRRGVVAACGARLVTSYGLRSLDRADPAYRGRYGGTVVERDGAYHQGTVWGWLIGPWVAALLRSGSSAETARSYLEPFRHQLQRYGAGTLAEIAGGDAPFVPDGCIAQAWTVGGVLAAWQATRSHAPAAPHPA